MNTLRLNPFLIAVAFLVIAGALAYAYYNTDLLDRFGEQETTSGERERIVAEQRKHVVDENGNFSVLMPASWSVEQTPASGSALSGVEATTENFAEEQQEGTTLITSGGRFALSATNAAITPPQASLIEEYATRLGSEPATLQVYRTANGRNHLLLVSAQRGSTFYEIRFSYNPGNYPYGEELFEDVLSTVELTPAS